MRLHLLPLASLMIAVAVVVGCSTSSAPDNGSIDQSRMKSQVAESESGGLADESVGNQADDRQAESAPGRAAAPSMSAKKTENASGGSQNKPVEDKAKAADPTAGMYIIRRATMTIQVPSVRDGLMKVGVAVKAAGGFVAGSTFEASEGQTPNARLTLRVPAKQFDKLVDSLGSVGSIFARNIDSDDVTMEFVDTGSRIRNLKLEESQLLKLLERTGKLLDVLQVERELARVRGEIEQSQGRLRHLGSLVDLSTIEVVLSEKVQVISTSPWASLPATMENAWADTNRSLASAIAWLMSSGIWLVGYWLPIALPAIALFVLLGAGLNQWLVRRRKVVPAVWFQRFWVGLGLALLAMQWPPLAGLILLAAIAAAVMGAGASFIGRFFIRKRPLD